jgi:flavodoxin/predicted small lipoprotein YifL
MKKMFTMLVLALCALTLTACGSSAPAKNSGSAPKAEAPKTETPKAAASSAPAGKRALVLYFSRADENYVVGNVEKGNTRILAEMIAEATGADTFEIKPAKPYPKEYTPATEVAKQEKNDNARPEIVGTMPDVSGYDVVFVGYPIWWGDLPMPCYTFFDKVKLEGWGTMKLEIESEKVDNLKDFRANKHIRGVRLHFLPESQNGSPELYKDLKFEKDKNSLL